MTARLVTVALTACAILALACGAPLTSSPLPTAIPTATTPTPRVPALSATAPSSNLNDDISGDVVVFAASSLTDAFNDLAGEFKNAHPNARAVFSFGGSSQLAIQLINGAHADVFASADQDQMDVVERGHVLAGAQQVFVRNRLMVIAPHDNPAAIASLQDLAKPGIKIVGAQASVPIGYYTSELLKSASANPNFGADFQRRVERNFVSREDTVRQIVAKIQLGEADAAVVYVTDVTPQIADQFVRVALPEDLQVTATYPIAVSNGRNRAGGEAFVAFVESPTAQSILARWGFLPPTEGA
jgi:molybdate transport system substrate-binding protein